MITKSKRVRKVLLTSLAALTLVGSILQSVVPASAQTNGIDIDFAGAEPLTYNHATGGGKWGNGTVNSDIERSLEGEDFACGDRVSYLTKIAAADTSELQALGEMTLDLRYSYDLDTTGQSGVALAEPFSVEITSGDSANNNDGGSAVSLLNITPTGPIFQSGSEMFVKIRLTDLEAGETVVIRTTVTLRCQLGSSPTGNVQAKFEDAFLMFKSGSTPVNPPDAINSGAKTVDLKSVNKVSAPEINISKTVTTQSGTCPGLESITIEPDEIVKFCYLVTNPSNSGGRLGAPLYNVSTILDDAGVIPQFTVALSSGLTDIDGDGQADDLAAGATATASYEVAFDGDKDTIITNVASVSGYDAPTGGNQISDSDTATVVVDAPEITLGLTISKLTNGSDGPSVLVGSTVNWTYLVTNTGNVELSSVGVIDDKGITVACPATVLAVGANMTCTASGVATAGSYTNLATATGSYLTETVTATDSSSYFGANPLIQIEKTPDSQVVKEGGKASFSVSITNTGNVPLTTVAVSDPLSPACVYSATSIAVAEVLTYTCSSETLTSGFTNTATVTALWNTTPVEDSDTASVILDYLPKISVTKEASQASVPESGANVTFTISVKNDSVENFSLTSLVDDKFGNLNGLGTCSVPQSISAGSTYTCTFAKLLSSEVLLPHVNVVTGSGVDPEQNPASDSDDASVSFTDVLPDISLTKVANPTAVKWTGDLVDYTLTVTNSGLETLTITSLIDNKLVLSSSCLALIGQVLAPGAVRTCTVLDVLVSGVAGGTFTNTATVTGVDNEANSDSATASANVNFWWYGRTPGYWKNHPEAWVNGYLPGNFIQSVFNVPTSLLKSGELDLDRLSGKDTLMNGLGYRGGSTLSGGAQILFRAAIAALLNEAYYGADFPIATSTGDLIAQVNAVLATGSRSTYVSFASYLDYWNNAVHASLP